MKSIAIVCILMGGAVTGVAAPPSHQNPGQHPSVESRPHTQRPIAIPTESVPLNPEEEKQLVQTLEELLEGVAVINFGRGSTRTTN